MTPLPSELIPLTPTPVSAVDPQVNRKTGPDTASLQTAKMRHKVSLRLLVVTAFVVPIVTAVGLTSWLSIRNGQQAVNNMAGQLQTEVGDRVSAHLDYYLSVPHQMNQINLNAIDLGLINLQDFNQLGKYFWKQMKVLNIGYINYANEQGEFIGVERLDNGELLINEVSQASTQGQLHVFQVNPRGDRTTLKETKTYDPRKESWYADAVKAKKPLWTDIYQWEDKPEVLSISSSYPVYDANQTLMGVIGIDLILSQIGRFLNQLNVSPSTKVFIVERNGLIVANSGQSMPYLMQAGKPQRVRAAESSDELIRATTLHLMKTSGSIGKLQTRQLVDFVHNGERRFAQITPWKDQWGLDWRIVVVTSESDFMAQINENTRNTIVLCGIAALIAALLGALIARWITEPVVRLSQASEAIASGDLNSPIAVKGIGEVGVLAQSFRQMTQQLKGAFTALTTANQELEQRVAERTATLQEESQALQQEVSHLLEVVAAVEDGDLTVEAEVSPLVTGLVADTLNRLVERLGQIMAIARTSSESMTHGSSYLEQLAVSVADNAEVQTQSLHQVQTLMERVNDLSQNAAQQAVATNEAVEQSQFAISQGQQEIQMMSQGIILLQQDTDQIVKRTETLTNYVEMATQFARDQKRIAAMTRVLAANASMLANRASTQQDPDQLAAITREFETISTQVNQLATQTNQSLVSLQQRTDQIQTVVSGLNFDVQEISQQVNRFVTGVAHSQQAFDTIQTVSEQVAQMGQEVRQSSQAIADAARTTLQSVRQISTISTATLSQADTTLTQAKQIEQLAQNLQHQIEFFQLPPHLLQAATPPAIPTPTTGSEPMSNAISTSSVNLDQVEQPTHDPLHPTLSDEDGSPTQPQPQT